MGIGRIILFLLALQGPLLAQTVRLLPHATVAAGPVQLGEIAKIEGVSGKTAETLSETLVLTNLTGTRTLKPEDILCAVMAGGQRDLALQLQVSGASVCEVTLAGNATKSAAADRPSALPPLSANRAVTADEIIPLQTLRAAAQAASAATPNSKPAVTEPATESLAQQLQNQVLAALQAQPEEVRISFDTIHPLLDQPTAPNQRWQFRPLVKFFLGTVQWEAQLMEGRQVVQHLHVQAKVLKRMQTVVANGPIQNGDILSAANVAAEESWVDRKIATQFVRTQDVVGQQAQRAIPAGMPLDQRDFKPVELVGRGDVATVYFVSTGLKIKISARALENGKLHDRITLRNEKTGDKLEATVIGKGIVAIGDLDNKTEQMLRESQ